jgi:hypothetical protein
MSYCTGLSVSTLGGVWDEGTCGLPDKGELMLGGFCAITG